MISSKCGGDCTTLRDGGEPVIQIPVLDLWERIEAAEKVGTEARQYGLQRSITSSALSSFEGIIFLKKPLKNYKKTV